MTEAMLRRTLPLLLVLGCSATQGTPSTGSGAEPTPEPNPTTAGEPVPKLDPRPISDSDLQGVSKSINAFSTDVYAEAAKTPGNLIVSPSSIAIALGMTYQGAQGATAKEFESVLHIADSGLTPDMWHAAAGQLGESWNLVPTTEQGQKPAPEVALANRLFGAEGLKFKDDFLAASQRDYRAPMERLDFGASEKARAHINDWVEDRTRDRIQDLLPEGALDQDTLLVLANAVYFKGEWTHTFREEATADAEFFVDGKDAAKVPTMRTTESFRYAKTDAATWIQMPYAGGRFAMTLAVPSVRDGLGGLESSLTSDGLSNQLEAMKYERVQLSLPKFKLEPKTSLTLSTVLKSLGLKRAFTDDAEFEGMVAPEDDRLKIDEVFHNGFIAVDEKGTEAAAATAVVMMRAGSVPSEPVKVDVDRPFMFVISDTQTGAIMFMGRVVDPR